jgi:hypothetical protein
VVEAAQVPGTLLEARKFDYGMTSFYRTIDTILWGRKTYDWVLSYRKK